MVRVLIADDHRLMREGTAALLAREPRHRGRRPRRGRCARRSRSRRRCAPTCWCSTSGCRELSGIEVCAEVRARFDDVQVLILTVSEQEPDLLAALRVGAAGLPAQGHAAGRARGGRARAPGAGEPRIPASMAGRVLSEVDAGCDGRDRGPLAARARGARADGRGAAEPRDRRAAVPQRADRQDPRAPPAGQAAAAQSRRGGGLRDARGAAGTASAPRHTRARAGSRSGRA